MERNIINYASTYENVYRSTESSKRQKKFKRRRGGVNKETENIDVETGEGFYACIKNCPGGNKLQAINLSTQTEVLLRIPGKFYSKGDKSKRFYKDDIVKCYSDGVIIGKADLSDNYISKYSSISITKTNEPLEKIVENELACIDLYSEKSEKINKEEEIKDFLNIESI